MYRSFTKTFLFITAFSCTVFSSFAQKSNKENSPYTRFGLGEFRNGVNVSLRGMGSISSAYSNEYSINTDNPASYAGLKLTTYEGGVEGSKRTISANGQSFPTGTVTYSYLTIGIPIGKNFGMALGLKPYTRVYYNLRDSVDMPGLGPSLRGYSGDGTVSYGYLGLAGKIKGFSAGINFGYLFGTISHASTLAAQYDSVNAFNSSFAEYLMVGDLFYKGGVMYETRLNKKLGLRAGATFATKQNMNAKRDQYQFTYKYLSSVGTVTDTAIQETGKKGSIVLPASYSIGLQLYNADKWMVGVDIATADWSQYKNFGATDSVADRTYKIAVGGEYTPNAGNIYKYLNRVTYRLGFYYGKDYVELRNNNLNYYAITAGASLPFRRSFDRVHLGMEIGKRGTESSGLIQENFFKFSVGMSLNDKWFVKRKYD